MKHFTLHGIKYPMEYKQNTIEQAMPKGMGLG